jgi:exonuclease III
LSRARQQTKKKCFSLLERKKNDILFLQDTHFENKFEQYITAEWGYQAYYASKYSRSRGVAIMFNNTFEFKIKEISKDTEENYIYILTEIKGENDFLINIYGPYRDNPDFLP